MSYFEQIKKDNGYILSKQQQRNCIKKYRETGDEIYREKLVRANWNFICYVAKKFTSINVSKSEMISAGTLGLLRAVEKYDLNQEASFISYARYWIELYIRIEIRKNWSVVRIPAGTYDELHRYYRYMSANPKATDEEIRECLGITESKLFTLKKLKGDVSIDVSAINNDTGKDISLLDVIGGDEEEAINNIDSMDLFQYLTSKVSELTEREQYVINKRFGLDGKPSQTLEDISQVINRTRERVRQIESQALRKIKKSMEKDGNQADIILKNFIK